MLMGTHTLRAELSHENQARSPGYPFSNAMVDLTMHCNGPHLGQGVDFLQDNAGCFHPPSVNNMPWPRRQ